MTYLITLLHLHIHQIDTARGYCGGTSEEYLGKIDWQKKGLKMETKLYPNVVCYLNRLCSAYGDQKWPDFSNIRYDVHSRTLASRFLDGK